MKRSRRLREYPVNRLFPNFVTILGLCAGLFALKFAMAEKWEMAVGLVVISAFIDGMDGRLARLLNASSSFGAQLDSLSDFVNFGVVPALIIYMWIGHEIRGFGWAVALFFIICMALRLARFNSALEEEPGPMFREHFFTGIPAPAGALLALVPMMLTFFFAQKLDMELPLLTPVVVTVFMGMIALLLVSRVPTFSFKKVRVPREMGTLVLALAALITIALILEPWVILPIVGAGYIILIPISVARYYRMKRVTARFR